MKVILAIDPGAGGAIVARYYFNTPTPPPDAFQSVKMPDTLKDIWDTLSSAIDGCDEPFAVMEKVGTYMPGNSGPSAATFAEHVGALKMALIGLGIRHEFIPPARWEHAYIGKPAYDKIPPETDPKTRRAILARRKQERKNKIKARSQQLFPNLKVTLANADALGMLWVAMQEKGEAL